VIHSVNKILQNLLDSQENNCSMYGAIGNALTQATGGRYSVTVTEGEIACRSNREGVDDCYIRFPDDPHMRGDYSGKE
jgi:hypothetical protein